MQVFKAFFKTLKKHLFSIMIYFFIFLALSLLLSGNGKQQTETVYKDTKVQMAVFDRDNSVLSKSMYEYLKNTQTIVTIKDDKDSITDELFYRNVEYVLIIKKGFEENLLAGNYEDLVENIKVPGSISGTLLDGKINQYLSALSAYTVGGFSPEEAAKKALETADITTHTDLKQIEGKETEKSSAYYFYSYIPYVLICMLISGLGSILLTFRNKDLNWRIKCSSMSETRRNTALILASFLFCFACWAAFVLLSLVIYRGDITGAKGMFFIVNSLVFLLIAMSLTYLITYLVKNLNALNMASNVVGLGLSFLGGIFVPLEYMSKSVLRFSKFLPTYWYVVTNEAIDTFTSQTSQYHTILRNLGIELLFVVIFLGAAIGLSRTKSVSQ